MEMAPCHSDKPLVAYGYCMDCFETWLSKRKPSERYGLSVEDAVALMKYQECKCYLCGYLFGTDMPVIDHDHLSGNPRGFAHKKCNSLIAFGMDSPDLIRKVAANLETPPYSRMATHN